MMNHYNERIVRLLQLYVVGEITEEGRRELEAWCVEAEEHRLFFDRIRQERVFAEERRVYGTIDEEKAMRAFEWQVGRSRKRSSRVLHLSRWWKCAVVFLIPLLAVCLWQRGLREEKTLVAVHPVGAIHPGSSQAILVLPDGGRVSLTEEGMEKVVAEQGVEAIREEGQLIYSHPVAGEVDVVKYHELETPRGGEFRVLLADGTRVRLNSATTFRYPVAFIGKERKVYLSGEAYFEVAKDAASPFLVEVDGVEVKVYGTSFNINTFREGGVQTVLVEGSVGVKVLSSGKESMIRPGQLAQFDKIQAKIEVREVNVALYTDWKDGIFRFENERLEDILERLSNWYNVDVFYEMSSVKELHFSGYMERYEQIETILHAVTISTGVRFSVQGQTIRVSK